MLKWFINNYNFMTFNKFVSFYTYIHTYIYETHDLFHFQKMHTVNNYLCIFKHMKYLCSWFPTTAPPLKKFWALYTSAPYLLRPSSYYLLLAVTNQTWYSTFTFCTFSEWRCGQLFHAYFLILVLIVSLTEFSVCTVKRIFVS